MVTLSNLLLGDIKSDVIICPIFDELIFQREQGRSLKNNIEQFIDFQNLVRILKYQYMDIGAYYKYNCPIEIKSYRYIYFLTIRTFLKKPSFLLVSNVLYKILEDILNENIKSITIPVFGIDCFSIETELYIIKDALLRIKADNPAVLNNYEFIISGVAEGLNFQSIFSNMK